MISRYPIGAALAAAGLALALGGCGGSHHTSNAELQLRRADLAQVAGALLTLRPEVNSELVAARAAWPLIEHGLPLPAQRAATTAPAHRLRVRLGSPGSTTVRLRGRAGQRDAAKRRAAEQAARHAARARRLYAALLGLLGKSAERAQRLPEVPVGKPDELTGPASSIAGLYALAAGLMEHSWREVQATAEAPGHATNADVAFLEANVNTYIIGVYDSHFDLSLLGRMVAEAYARLGGAKEFGDTLTAGQVATVTAAYSPTAVRLHPHAWEGLVKQIEADAAT